MKLKLIHGHGEIKKISNQVKTAFKILDGKNLVNIKDSRLICNKMNDLGFESASSSGIAFIGKTQVIKCGLLTRRPPPRHHRVPTLIYAYENITPTQWEWDTVLLIQPKVDNDFEFDDEDLVKAKRVFNRLSGCDAHEGNIGMYKGKFRLFDW